MLTSTFYTGLPNYATFLALFNFLNPGEDGENILPRSTLKDVPEDFMMQTLRKKKTLHLQRKDAHENSNQLKNFLLCYAAWEEAFLSAI